MDLEYFKNQINDEICGAKDYAIKAMELKPMNITWTKKLVEMATSELTHAANLYDMFNEYYRNLSASYPTGIPDYISAIHKDIMSCYTKCYPEAKILIEMASK